MNTEIKSKTQGMKQTETNNTRNEHRRINKKEDHDNLHMKRPY